MLVLIVGVIGDAVKLFNYKQTSRLHEEGCMNVSKPSSDTLED